ncbi:MAG: very short patch repair endonuclease [Thalassobaculaceae bacterium]|uniref:very short patch repair endonuclease n=1 Tax=Roseitalea porphyridii TaxID=1852022 RepID=UPI0032EB5F59
MVDRLTKSQRSRNMSRIGRANTRPELAVRRILHRAGYRFRLHRRELPGTPDIVLPGRRTVVFVHGCFWHRHPGCRHATVPSTRRDFWLNKFEANVCRDSRVHSELAELGWNVVVVWECEIRDHDTLLQRLCQELEQISPTRLARASKQL